MYRIITWINCLKVRLKSKRFIIPIIFALTLLFFPNDAFALEISNVQFYNNGSLVHTFNKNEIQGQYASINPIEVDAMHINYSDVTQKNSYNYQFQGNFDMAGNRVFDSIRAFNINNGVTQQPSTSKWVLYSVEVAEPFYNGNYNISADWTSINDSNVLSLQFDLGGDMILSAFRLNTSRLLNDGEDVGDSITNQTQEIIQNQDKNQQQTNERLDALIGEFKSCKVSDNLFSTWEVGGIHADTGLVVPTDFRLRTSNFINVYPEDYYFTLANTNYKFVALYFWDSNNNYLGYFNSFPNLQNFNYKFSDNVKKIKVVIGKVDNSQINTGDVSLAIPKMQRGKDGVHCTNKIDETNEKLDSLDKTLNDDNVSGATSTGNDFFDNFNSKDNGGISRIVTMPLTLINGLISGGACSNLEFEVLGKEVYFPSGCILWQNAPGAIVTIYHTIICGLFSYILATHLFKDIEDLKNPNKEEVSTLDL